MTDNQQPTQTSVPTTGPDQHLDADAVGRVAARGHGNPTQVHDPGSDLVDTDDINLKTDTVPEVEEMKVFYAFAGGNMGGQGLFTCSLCSGIVQEAQQDKHTQWHRNGGQ